MMYQERRAWWVTSPLFASNFTFLNFTKEFCLIRWISENWDAWDISDTLPSDRVKLYSGPRYRHHSSGDENSSDTNWLLQQKNNDFSSKTENPASLPEIELRSDLRWYPDMTISLRWHSDVAVAAPEDIWLDIKEKWEVESHHTITQSLPPLKQRREVSKIAFYYLENWELGYTTCF